MLMHVTLQLDGAAVQTFVLFIPRKLSFIVGRRDKKVNIQDSF